VDSEQLAVETVAGSSSDSRQTNLVLAVTLISVLLLLLAAATILHMRRRARQLTVGPGSTGLNQVHVCVSQPRGMPM
jgi:hypothetical protein